MTTVNVMLEAEVRKIVEAAWNAGRAWCEQADEAPRGAVEQRKIDVDRLLGLAQSIQAAVTEQ